MTTTSFSHPPKPVDGYDRIGRCVDSKGVQKWLAGGTGFTQDDWDHDGKSWRQRERDFDFRVIGLKPSDFPFFESEIPCFPPGFKEALVVKRLEVYVPGMANSAEEVHLHLARVARTYSNKETWGPLACKMTAVFMKNDSSVSRVGKDGEREVPTDNHPNPLELWLIFEYLDPEAAAKRIENLKAKGDLK